MASLYVHGKSFVNRLRWLTPLMGGWLPASKYLIQARGKPMALGYASYKDQKFEFRNCDSTAVKEVLVDEEYSFLVEFLNTCERPVIVDVGAHIGTFSLWVHQTTPNAHILMVEANPESYALLVRNMKNNFPEHTWQAINKAAWKNDEKLNFSTAGDSMGNKVSPEGTVQVKGVTFKTVVDMALEDRSKTVDLMKIDIEGAEEAFFETADMVLSKIERLVIELHPKLCDVTQVEQTLQRHFSSIKNIANRIDDKPLLYCTRSA